MISHYVALVSLILWAPQGATKPPLPRRPSVTDVQPVRIEVFKDRIEFTDVVGMPGAVYVIDPAQAKPYFWPLNAPGDLAVTRGWPMVKDAPGDAHDHIHQKSAWFCHGDVFPEGIEFRFKHPGVSGVDFWSETPGHGNIVCTKVDDPETRGGRGKVVTHNEWRSVDGIKILDEKRTIHYFYFGTARLIVIDSDMHASAVPITFADTKEGSLGVRVCSSLCEEKGKGTLTNAEGKVHEKNVWGRISDWCDYSGPIGDKTAGLTIFASPANPIPTCWHSRAYGLMAANPFGRQQAGFPDMKGKTDLVKLAKGEHLKLRYGILLHVGDVKSGKVAEYFERFKKLD